MELIPHSPPLKRPEGVGPFQKPGQPVEPVTARQPAVGCEMRHTEPQHRPRHPEMPFSHVHRQLVVNQRVAPRRRRHMALRAALPPLQHHEVCSWRARPATPVCHRILFVSPKP